MNQSINPAVRQSRNQAVVQERNAHTSDRSPCVCHRAMPLVLLSRIRCLRPLLSLCGVALYPWEHPVMLFYGMGPGSGMPMGAF